MVSACYLLDSLVYSVCPAYTSHPSYQPYMPREECHISSLISHSFFDASICALHLDATLLNALGETACDVAQADLKVRLLIVFLSLTHIW